MSHEPVATYEEIEEVSARKASRLLHIDDETLRRKLEAGEIKHRRTEGGHYRIPLWCLKDYQARTYQGGE